MNSRFTTKTIAFCAMMASLATVLMLAGGLIPIMTYCAPLFGALCLIPVNEKYGSTPAWTTWAAVSILTLLIGADKEAAFFWIFFSWYPIIKKRMDSISPKPMKTALKLLLFTASALIMYALTCYVLGIEEIIESFSERWWLNAVFLAAVVAVMMIYDYALDSMQSVIMHLTDRITGNRR